jgi:hypothetical protein
MNPIREWAHRMTDPNIRRLLGAARGDDEPQHFAFLRRCDGGSLRDALAREHAWASSGRPTDDNLHRLEEVARVAALGGHTANDMTLMALGVQVVWFDRFDELPGLVAGLSS